MAEEVGPTDKSSQGLERATPKRAVARFRGVVGLVRLYPLGQVVC